MLNSSLRFLNHLFFNDPEKAKSISKFLQKSEDNHPKCTINLRNVLPFISNLSSRSTLSTQDQKKPRGRPLDSRGTHRNPSAFATLQVKRPRDRPQKQDSQ
ncbi:hypothetical protein P9112_000247 [Eukaryota sp. TZLM1-RC]